jgi:TonB family protein
VPTEWRSSHSSVPCKDGIAQFTIDMLIPRYPRAAEQTGEEQTLLYELQVDSSGTITTVRLLGEAGVAFRIAAERAISHWRFHFADADAACIVGNRFQVPVQFKMLD